MEYFQALCIIDGAIKWIELVFFSEISTREIVNEEFLMIITTKLCLSDLFVCCCVIEVCDGKQNTQIQMQLS